MDEEGSVAVARMPEVLIKEESNDLYSDFNETCSGKRILNYTINEDCDVIKTEKNFDSLRNFRFVKPQNFRNICVKKEEPCEPVTESKESNLEKVICKPNLSENLPVKTTTNKSTKRRSRHPSLTTLANIQRTIESVIKKYTTDLVEDLPLKKEPPDNSFALDKSIEPSSFKCTFAPPEKHLDPKYVSIENPLPLKCIIEEEVLDEAPQSLSTDNENEIQENLDEDDKIYENVVSPSPSEALNIQALSHILNSVGSNLDEVCEDTTTPVPDESSTPILGAGYTIAAFDSATDPKTRELLNNPFECPDCHKVLSSAGNLRRHVNTKHRGMKPFVCPQCSFGFGEKASLEKHVMAIHDKIRPFRCSECDKSFVTKSSLVKHIQSSHDSRPGIRYECSLCKESRSFSRSGFRLHWLRNHDPDPNAAAHVRKRSSKTERKFQCPLCPTRFGSRPAVNTHVLTKHEGARPFGCPLCKSTFSSKNHIKRHIDATHKKLRPFSCHLCTKKFSYKSFLQRHISHTHLGVKAFECSVCKTSFSEKANMLRHIDMVHKQLKPFVCHICNCKYCDKAGLKHHLSSKHGINTV